MGAMQNAAAVDWADKPDWDKNLFGRVMRQDYEGEGGFGQGYTW